MSHVNNNKLTKHYWYWPIVWDLFFGGLGGGILTIVGIFDLVFRRGVTLDGAMTGAIPQLGSVFALAVLLGVIALGLGSFLLIFELGQPKVFLRVFLSRTAIIKYGASLLVLSMLFGIVYFLFFLPPAWNLFYYGWTWLRDICCVCMMITGFSVIVYTGVLLSSMKAKPFWNTPILPVLFTVSALATGTALTALTAGLWPATTFELVHATGITTSGLTDYLTGILYTVVMVLIIAQIIVMGIYVLMMYGAGNITARTVALKWLTGSFAPLFWFALLCCGLLAPFFLYISGAQVARMIAPFLVLGSGVLLRFMIIYSDARRPIPGEERYWARMPKGDEEFLTAWKQD